MVPSNRKVMCVTESFGLSTDNPGCHLRKIKDELDVGMGTVQYHLDKLEKAGRITSQKLSLHKYYFLVGVFEENEKHILEVLSNETAREILMFIIEHNIHRKVKSASTLGYPHHP